MIALPIWTAPPESSSLSSVSSADEKVAPWIPSRPVRPPTVTTRSPGRAALVGQSDGDRGHVAAEDQWIAQVTVVEADGPVDGGDAHPVAVVTNTRDDSSHHATRMQHTRRQFFDGRVGPREAEDVGVADRSCSHPGSQRITDHAAEPRVGSSVGLKRRGVIVCLDLEADIERVVERDDPGVVAKDADAPVVVTEPLANHGCRFEDGLLEHLVEVPFGRFIAVVNPTAEGLVRAVFAPGLCDGFEFDVGGIAIERDTK